MLWWLRLTCPLVLTISDGKVTCVRGKLPTQVTTDIRDLLADAGVRDGSIHMSGNGRFGFSSSIPQSCHQQLRNFLASA